jgi:hypothetical protein
MLTPSHVVYSLAILGRKNKFNDYKAIFFGALLPDLSTYLFFPIQLLIGKSPDYIWNIVYFEYGWQIWFGLTHSLWLWPLILLISVFKKWKFGIFFFSSTVLHVFIDFLVHATDAYPHFAPFSMWKFYSPISYYDPNYYGNIFSILEIIGFGICAYLIYPTLKRRIYKVLLGFTFLFLLLIGLIFQFIV